MELGDGKLSELHTKRYNHGWLAGWLAGGVGWVVGGTAAAGAKECMYGVDRYY